MICAVACEDWKGQALAHMCWHKREAGCPSKFWLISATWVRSEWSQCSKKLPRWLLWEPTESHVIMKLNLSTEARSRRTCYHPPFIWAVLLYDKEIIVCTVTVGQFHNKNTNFFDVLLQSHVETNPMRPFKSATESELPPTSFWHTHTRHQKHKIRKWHPQL